MSSRLLELLRDVRARLGRRAFSQEGEDLILLRYFGSKRDGFFVDVGAHHPYRFSNTFLLYRQGWRGVNIDATPGSMRKFRRLRPRDINIEVGIGMEASTATFYIFNEPALNTFDRALAEERQVPPWRLVSEVSVPVRPLRDVLAEVVPGGQKIDLLTVDVEGRDLDVLRSNDWARFRPAVVIAETLGHSMTDLEDNPAAALLKSLGYAIAAKTYNSTFMIDRSSELMLGECR